MSNYSHRLTKIVERTAKDFFDENDCCYELEFCSEKVLLNIHPKS
jgi:hypothetical protein